MPHLEATDLAFIVHTFLAPASGLLLLLWPFLNLLFWNTAIYPAREITVFLLNN